MKRIGEIIDRSLTEVRLRVDPKVHAEPVHLLQLVDQIALTAEVEDECGGLSSNTPMDLFKSFEQQNENKKGLGLGLTIVKRAITLCHGTIDILSLPGKGCTFKITLPKKMSQRDISSESAA
jgi:K+-sensing histidine kinase KdpD